MTLCGNDIQRKKISNLSTADMYVAEELWSLCWTDVFITVPLSQNIETALKMLSEEKNNMQKKWLGMGRRTKNTTEYR